MEQLLEMEYGDPKVLTGDGITVETVRIGPAEDDKHLLRVKNAANPYRQRVKMHRRVNNGKSFHEWQAKRDDSTFRLIIERHDSISNRYELWLPGRRMGIMLQKDDQLSEQLDATELVDAWKAQR